MGLNPTTGSTLKGRTMSKDKCPNCNVEVYIKYASKNACKLLEMLTRGLINAKEVYFNLPSGPILTNADKYGALHVCEKKEEQ